MRGYLLKQSEKSATCELVDLLALQSEISCAVARKIQGRLSLDRVAALTHKESVDAEALPPSH